MKTALFPRRPSRPLTTILLVVLVAVGGATLLLLSGGGTPAPRAAASGTIHLIKHVIIIMQENHSFDNYFGTYPGADGIPMASGTPTVCAPNPATGRCDMPYHDTLDSDYGGSHTYTDTVVDINSGKMNGFVKDAELSCFAEFGVPGSNPACQTHGPFT